ncbi:MAG: hypothetical protein QM770_04060 [Tepidisphaeraceae bacterium]
MDGQDLLKLSLGERLVTVARLLAAEHVRQELSSPQPDDALPHRPTLTQLIAPCEEEPVQQHRYTPALKEPVKKEAA